MSPSHNRHRLSVDPAGKWRLYTPRALRGAEVLGTVTRGTDDTGALMRIKSTGTYVQVNGGGIRALDGRKIAAALGTTGRPPEMQDGRRVNVYLDSPSLDIATRAGDGNVSAGIRRALDNWQETQQ